MSRPAISPLMRIPASFLGALIWLLGRLPVAIRRELGAACGVIASHLPTKASRVCMLQLKVFAGVHNRSVSRKAFANVGRTIFECFNLKPLLARPDQGVSVDGMDEVLPALAAKRGLVALTAHTGNWDLLGAAIVSRGYPLAVIAREAKGSLFQSVLRTLRDQTGVRTFWRANKAEQREMLAYLEGGGVLAVLVDQDTRVKSAHVPFFGESAATPRSLVDYAVKERIPLCSALMTRDVGSNFSLHVRMLHQGSTEEILQEFNLRLESLLRKDPSQWVWFHKRWRTPRTGERPGGRVYIASLAERARKAVIETGLVVGKTALLISICLALTACFLFPRTPSSLECAEELTRAADIPGAISAYENHIKARLLDEDRPEWEIPQFYELSIGDLYLRSGEVPLALARYERASQAGVEPALVGDRYRSVAQWYVDRGELQSAFDLLQHHRAIDPLLFDSMLDRVAKRMTELEQKKMPRTEGAPVQSP